MTRQRQLVYNIVTAAPVHLTAEEIFQKARQKMPSLARGTVYRNLGILVEDGKIRKLEMPGAPACYDRECRPHPHLVCDCCGKVDDLTMPEGLLDPLLNSLDTEITGYDIMLFYVCDDCKNGNTAE